MTSSTHRRQHWMAVAGTALVLGVDQATKAAGGSHATARFAHPARNAEFSLQLAHASQRVETGLMAAVLVVVVALCVHGMRRGWLRGAVAGLLVGGCLGNLLDRALLGSVRDFLPVGHVVLNVADVAVVVGVAAAAVARRRFIREGR